MLAAFANAADMDEVLVARWNAVVGADDVVWHLGDVARRPADVAELLARLNGEMNRIITVPETRQTMSQQGADPLGSTPEEFAAVIAVDIAKWKKVVAAAGIKPDQ